jgi:hypothetical protein
VTVSALALDPKRRRRYLPIAFGFGALVVLLIVVYLILHFLFHVI